MKGTLHEGYFTWRVLYMTINTHFPSYLARIFLNWETFQTKVAERIKTHIFASVIFVPFMRKGGKILYSEVGHRWPYGARALHAGYLRLQIDTLRLHNTQFFSTATVVAWTLLIVTLYVHCLSCYIFVRGIHCAEETSTCNSGQLFWTVLNCPKYKQSFHWRLWYLAYTKSIKYLRIEVSINCKGWFEETTAEHAACFKVSGHHFPDEKKNCDNFR